MHQILSPKLLYEIRYRMKPVSVYNRFLGFTGSPTSFLRILTLAEYLKDCNNT